jgi:hypothetical protein
MWETLPKNTKPLAQNTANPPPQKEKEELDDITTELELADEDDTVP